LPEPNGEAAITVPSSLKDRVWARIELPKTVRAPVQKGQKIGRIVYEIDKKEIGSVDLVAPTEIQRGGFFRILIDTVLRFFAFILGKV